MKVLMPTYGGAHVTIVIPVAKELLKRGDEPIILGFAAALPSLEKSGLRYRSLQDYMFLFAKEKKEIFSLGEKLAADNHNLESNIDYIQTVLYYGISMYFLLKEKGEEEAWSLFKEKNRKAFLPVEVLERIIQFEQPDIVTATCDVRMELAGAIAARKHNVVSLYMCDVDYLSPHHEKFDYISTFSEMHKNRYLAIGVKQDKIFVTGQPAFDHLFDIKPCDARKKLQTEFAIGLDKKIVTWISRVTDENIRKIFYELLAIAKRREDLYIVAKLHPASQNISDFNFTNEENYLETFKVTKDYNVQELLAASDLVIVLDSACGHEAMILNRKLLVINIAELNYNVRYGNNNVSLVLEEDIDKLEEFIIRGLSEENAIERFIEGRKKYLIEKDGAKRTVDLIHSLVNK